MPELTLDELNGKISARIAYIRHAGVSEKEKVEELKKISRLIRFRDDVEAKIAAKTPDTVKRIKSLRVKEPMSQKEKDELMVLIDSV